ncbi:MAG: sodium-translocating pyrophosphatase [Candidatus Cloacimonetes bacterium]|nr:sodium-translocating pyrophosphatase [Candidatus Cloacimonadota bacterium]
MNIPLIWYLAPLGATVALAFALIFYYQVKAHHPGNPRMIEIAGFVREGAFAYLRQQYKGVILFFIGAFIVFQIMALGLKVLHPLVPWAFLTGGFFSGLAGFIGMNMATLASNRTAQACTESLNKGLQVSFRAGSVMGLTVVGLALIDISAWFYILNYYEVPLNTIAVIMLSFGMGASTQALFARLGGGIFTKAADVGADLVGKIEAGIPEDDARNPATIADNVGDNVGDVAGMGADLYESYAGSILATASLGMGAVMMLGPQFADYQLNFLIAPMVLAGIGALLSVFGIFMVRTKEDASTKDLMFALNKSVYFSSALIAVAAFFVTKSLLPPDYYFGVFLSSIIGLLTGILIGWFTERATSHSYKPTQRIARQSRFGTATVILEGISVGMSSTAAPVITVVVGIMLAFISSHGFQSIEMGLYGIGFGAVGMLATLGVTLATDAFGPIADNAGGNAQMSGLSEIVRERTDSLDSVGNTTAATGKGFAIGSAALTAMALLAAYLEEARAGLLMVYDKVGKAPFFKIKYSRGACETINVSKASIQDFINYYQIHVLNPKFLMGVFIGAMVAYLFSALTIKAVGRAAGKMVGEVRRQFDEIPGILEGTSLPDYKSCVTISTKAAQREMVVPAIVGIGTPIVVGLIFGVAGVLGVLAGALSAGFVLAIMMNNAGGAWDNAKKFVETGECGGKNSPAHTATIVGDTVGDPFKDTAGPCINILIKLMSMVSIVFVGVILSYSLSVERIQPPMTGIKIKEEIHNEIISIDKTDPHSQGHFLPREMDEESGFRNCGEKWQAESQKAIEAAKKEMEEDAKAKEALR